MNAETVKDRCARCTSDPLDADADLAELLSTARAEGFREGVEAAAKVADAEQAAYQASSEAADRSGHHQTGTNELRGVLTCREVARLIRALTPPAPRETTPEAERKGGPPLPTRTDLLDALDWLRAGCPVVARHLDPPVARRTLLALIDALPSRIREYRWPPPTPASQTAQDKESE